MSNESTVATSLDLRTSPKLGAAATVKMATAFVHLCSNKLQLSLRVDLRFEL